LTRDGSVSNQGQVFQGEVVDHGEDLEPGIWSKFVAQETKVQR
jgi:hypothetical protein